MALKGLKVIEMAGLAPAPMCGMILSDFGAQVTRIDKSPHASLDVLTSGKRCIALNLKQSKAVELVKKLSAASDVLIEPFRPGVMEKFGLGPEILLEENPKLIYARLTGFGSNGKGIYADRAGHDINYLSTSGVLSMLGRRNEKPYAPINFAADFAGGGLLCAFGICTALLERHRSGKGQIVDSAMVEGSAYVASWLFRSRDLPVWGQARGENMLDGGSHFYDTYETKDGKFMAVGALEPQFYAQLLKGLNLSDDEVPQFDGSDNGRKKFTEIFKSKSQEEWREIFDPLDACVTPVVEWKDAADFDHNKAREVFKENNDDVVVPNPAPKLSRTPAKSSYGTNINEFDAAVEVFKEIGVDKKEVINLYEQNILLFSEKPKL